MKVFLVLFMFFINVHTDAWALSFKCNFNQGEYASFENNKIERGEAGKAGNEIIYDSLNVSTGKGRMIGNLGAVDVLVLQADGGVTAIEKSDTGNLSIVTIYYDGEKKKEYFAVYSRHIKVITPLVSQYYGFCTSIS